VYALYDIELWETYVRILGNLRAHARNIS